MIQKNKISIFIAIGLIISLLILIVSGCTQQTPAQAPASPTTAAPAPAGPKSGGVMKISMMRDATSLGYPGTLMGGWFSQISSKTTLERLVRFDEKGNIAPWLAESWTTDAASKSATIKLRKGVKFHDGTDFNAAAVKWNFEKFIAAGRSELPKPQSMEIVDDYTLKINLVNWDNVLMYSIAAYAGDMVSPTAWQNAPGATTDKERIAWADTHPVGTGPFQLVSWQKDVKQVYKKFNNYYIKGRPYLDGVEWIIIGDPMTASAALKAKEVDILHVISTSLAKDLKNSGFKITEHKSGLGGNIKGLITNSASANSPFNNIKLRQAISYAIDRQAIANGVFSGFATPLHQWAAPVSDLNDPNFKKYPYDPEMAKKLVAEAGFPNGLKTTLMTENTPDEIALATALQQMLSKVNITVELNPVTAAKHIATINDAAIEAMDVFNIKSEAEPAIQYYRILKSNGVTYVKSIIHPDDMEKLVTDQRAAPDQESKKKLTWQLQDMVMNKYCILTPVVLLSSLDAKQQYVKNDGLLEIDFTQWTPWEAWLDK